jgi:hypothetical protein
VLALEVQLVATNDLTKALKMVRTIHLVKTNMTNAEKVRVQEIMPIIMDLLQVVYLWKAIQQIYVRVQLIVNLFGLIILLYHNEIYFSVLSGGSSLRYLKIIYPSEIAMPIRCKLPDVYQQQLRIYNRIFL